MYIPTDGTPENWTGSRVTIYEKKATDRLPQVIEDEVLEDVQLHGAGAKPKLDPRQPTDAERRAHEVSQVESRK